jgi:hypothetical protein
VSCDKITSTFECVKIKANHYISLRMRSHHVISRLAHLAFLQFVRLNRWRSLIRFLHYLYYYWSRDHFCSFSSLRDNLYLACACIKKKFLDENYKADQVDQNLVSFLSIRQNLIVQYCLKVDHLLKLQVWCI